LSVFTPLDGNGRIGRAIAEKSLSENLGAPTLIALSQTIERKRKVYYDALEHNNKNKEITDWLVYFSETILKAENYSPSMIDILIEKTKLYRSSKRTTKRTTRKSHRKNIPRRNTWL